MDDQFLTYFVERTDAALIRIEDRLDKVTGFRWMAIGGMIAVSSIVSTLISIALVWYEIR